MSQSRQDQFINNVMCRRESNQHKASKLWQEAVKHTVPDDLKQEFLIDWEHYRLGEFGPEVFRKCILKCIIRKIF